MQMGYVVCKKCGSRISVPFKSHEDAPMRFYVVCNNCKHLNVCVYCDVKP
jgi:hypothetical protein